MFQMYHVVYFRVFWSLSLALRAFAGISELRLFSDARCEAALPGLAVASSINCGGIASVKNSSADVTEGARAHGDYFSKQV